MRFGQLGFSPGREAQLHRELKSCQCSILTRPPTIDPSKLANMSMADAVQVVEDREKLFG